MTCRDNSVPKENQIGSEIALYSTDMHTCPPPQIFPAFIHIYIGANKQFISLQTYPYAYSYTLQCIKLSNKYKV